MKGQALERNLNSHLAQHDPITSALRERSALFTPHATLASDPVRPSLEPCVAIPGTPHSSNSNSDVSDPRFAAAEQGEQAELARLRAARTAQLARAQKAANAAHARGYGQCLDVSAAEAAVCGSVDTYISELCLSCHKPSATKSVTGKQLWRSKRWKDMRVKPSSG